MAGVESEVYLAAKIGLVGDTRLKSVAQLVIDSLGIVFVEVGADDVDIGREVASRMGLGVLLVSPLDLEVVAFLIVSGAFRSYLVDSEAQRHRAVVLVSPVVAKRRLETP